MESIFTHKEGEVTQTPLLLFETALPGGEWERWSTHRVLVEGHQFEPRVIEYNRFEISTAADQGVDVIPRVAVTLANADGYFSQRERTVGWKGREVTVSLLFYDLVSNAAATDRVVLFRGLFNAPEEITEATFRLSAVNRMNLQRTLVPGVRIQKRCPWTFPSNAAERAEAVSGGEEGPYSLFYKCGYAPDQTGGQGNLASGGAPFTTCGYSRSDCEARGMFRADAAGRPTARYGGIEFVPPAVQVRGAGDKSWQTSAVRENEARYNDVVPLVYGTCWYAPPIVFSRNDGNLTYLEVLLGQGVLEGVLKVLVNDVDIPLGVDGKNMTGTGWFNVVSLGQRTGGFNLNFRDASGTPLGDPYGSMAYLSVVVPNRVSDGRSLPQVRVLVKGMRLDVFDAEGAYAGTQFTNNPAWILLDVLRRTGWRVRDLDLPSFHRAAAYCGAPIAAEDLHGNPTTIPRFQCNLAIQKRRSAAELMRAIRQTGRLMLTYAATGALRVSVEGTLAEQQPTRRPGSNAATPLLGGWPAYEFGDGTQQRGGILRRPNGASSLRVLSRPTNETPNRYAIEFQDEFNEYQQDSLSLVDLRDVERTGQEITGPVHAVGVANFSQAARTLKYYLDRSVRGNVYVEFDTSVRGIGLQPGDLVTVTYLREGFDRQLFRIIRLAPAADFRTVHVVAQIHEESWYGDGVEIDTRAEGRGRQPAGGLRAPRPLAGAESGASGWPAFGITEKLRINAGGGVSAIISAAFQTPNTVTAFGPAPPAVGLAPETVAGGSLEGDAIFYYALSAVNTAGEEGELSFIVRAQTPPGPGWKVKLTGLSFPGDAATFHVYRGASPQQLYRIRESATLAQEFVDTGLSGNLVTPPDSSFHHANFYWRWEVQAEVEAGSWGPTALGNGNLEMAPGEHVGRGVRITRGKGAGQERRIVANSGTLLTVAPPWSELPDSTSRWVIMENGWVGPVAASSSPAVLEVPYREGATIHITGRAANANDVESVAELSPVTRWRMGEESGAVDDGVPPAPHFAVSVAASPRGVVELSGISFESMENTRQISSATATLFYVDELDEGARSLSAAASAEATVIAVSGPSGLGAGEVIQIEAEILRIEEVLPGGGELRVRRGLHGSAAAGHSAGSAVYPLRQRTTAVAFPRGYFGSPAAGSWRHAIALPNARVASAQMYVSNAIGNSAAREVSFTQTIDRGLRTLAGGQITLTIDGFLAVQTDAIPAFAAERDYSTGVVQAFLLSPPTGPEGPGVTLRLRLNNQEWCQLMVPHGAVQSNAVNGRNLPVIRKESRLSLDVLTVGAATPGSGLTVVIQV
jgi:hypothetical protein